MATTLTDRFSSVLIKLQNGSKSLDVMLEILRLRVDAETQFTNSLHKIIECAPKLISSIDSTESIRTHGFDALYCDMKNEYVQRAEFLNSLKQDVYQPCQRMKQIYEQSNKSFVHDIKLKTKLHKQHQNDYLKLKEQYDKIMAKNAKKNTKIKKEPSITRKYSQKQLIWKQQQNAFDVEMSSFIDVEMLMEYQRMHTLKDGLTKWAAFITNLSANRSYDVQNLARSMALINIEQDLHCFMKRFSDEKQQIKKQKTSYSSSLYADFRKQSA